MAPHGVRVNAIGPGSIMTDVLAAVANDENGMRRILSRTPMMRIGDPLEVGQVRLCKSKFQCDCHLVAAHAVVEPVACAEVFQLDACRWRPSWRQMLRAT